MKNGKVLKIGQKELERYLELKQYVSEFETLKNRLKEYLEAGARVAEGELTALLVDGSRRYINKDLVIALIAEKLNVQKEKAGVLVEKTCYVESNWKTIKVQGV